MVARDDLESPLGRAAGPDGSRRRPAGAWFAMIGCVAALGAAVLYAHNVRSDTGGAGYAEIIRPPKNPPAHPKTSAPAADAGFEIEDGVKVIRGGGIMPSAGELIRVPQTAADQNDAEMKPAPDPRLVEPGPYGPLPKIASNGATPFEIYKHPLVAAGESPKVAIILTGMGLNETLTRQADQLPGEITFAFAPIARDLWAQAARSRQAGHEMLLQAPMEALATDGGSRWPHELSSAQSPTRNLQNLRWSLAQFPGYIGVMNFLGSKLTADAAAFSPLLKEIAGRGLAYVDDGTSAGSLAMQLASGLQLPFAQADVSIDLSGGPEAAQASLARLVVLARAHGSAIGVAPGLPSVLSLLAAYDQRLSAEGVALVPASALIGNAPSGAASAQ